jgi:hypothetical protein
MAGYEVSNTALYQLFFERFAVNPYLFVCLPIKTKKTRTFGAHLHNPARGKVGYGWHGAAKLITGF